MKLSRQIAERHEEERAEIVTDDLDEHWENLAGSRIIRKDFTAKEVFENAKGDKLRRSLIRHDSDTLAKIVSDIASGKI